jgi:hypothetical protein
MPVMWGTHNGSQIFIQAGVIDATAFQGPLIAGGQIPRIPNPPMFTALVDTGAQVTMISPRVAQTVGLKPIGQMPIQGVGHAISHHNAYLFHVAFVIPITSTRGIVQDPGNTVTSMIFVMPSAIYGGEITATGDNFDVLLGMDVISAGSFKVEVSGHYSFAF